MTGTTAITDDEEIASLRSELQRLRALNEAALNLTSIVDVDGRIRYESASAARIVGWRPAELEGRNAFEFVHPEDRSRAASALSDVVTSRYTGQPIEYRFLSRHAGWRWLESVAVDCREVAGVEGIVLHSRDVTERRENRSRLDRLARYDELTGLLNRASLRHDLPRAVERAAASGRLGAVLFVDLDRFKIVNDTLGHAVGDLVLHEIARRLTEALRASDAVYRVGGDEFVVVVEDALNRDDVTTIARALGDALNRPVLNESQELPVGASIGIALFPLDGRDPDELLRRADTAMYRVKESGRGGFHFYTPGMEAALKRRLDLERELRRALRNDDLVLVYQPVVSLPGEGSTWVEALVRWPQDDGTARTAEHFMPVAAETGLIVPLGTWALRAACRTARRWHDAGVTARVSVHVSALQIEDEAFADVVAGVLEAEGLTGAALTIDVSESAVASASDAALDTLQRIRAQGTLVALDDFGAGTSALAALRRFPVDALKVHAGFVTGIGTNARDEALVRAIVAMGRGTGTAVVAEGVETLAQLNFLRELGCDAAQGHLLAPTLDEDDIVPWLRRRAGAAL